MSTSASPSFPRSSAWSARAAAPLTVLDATGSTNADLLAAAPTTPHLGAVVTLDQTAGRGRLDRTWSAPPGETLAASVLVRADLDERDRGWLPLVAGAAVRDAVASVLATTTGEGGGTDAGRASRTTTAAERVVVKWPNDVLVDDRKVCGVLCQVAADGSVAVGAGVNLTIPADRLPTPAATSLAVAGATGSAPELADAVLVAFLAGLQEAVAALVAGGTAAETARSHVRDVCATIGRPVRLELPDGSTVEADATGIDDDGRITIRDRAGAVRSVAVGDVTHLRYA